MVALAAPGDRVRVRLDRVKGNVCFASIVEVIEASPVRIEPPCPYFGRCGGCDFQQLTYEAQLSAKIEIVKDCLHRIGRLDNYPELQITAAPHQWRYRSRAQWQYDSVRKQIGYFESGSRRICDVAECAVLVPELQHTLAAVRQQMDEGLLPAEVKYFRAVAGDCGVALTPGIKSAAAGPDRLNNISRAVRDEKYLLNAESFFQTNLDLLPQLIEGSIGKSRGVTAVELYCGVGLFTLPLARRFRKVVAVEESSDAVRFAQMNLANAGLTNTEIVNSDVGLWLQRQVAAEELDLVLLDPPRIGAESRVIDGILQLRPKQICYVSCDPATLARDLRKIIAGGFVLDSLAAFDMFPQTHHVETVANLVGP